MILLIDNYDSFSYNLYQLVGSINSDIKVIRNDEMIPEEIEKLHPSHIIISPGPGKPSDAGFCEKIIDYFKNKVPILGVCLGHQAVCEVFGAQIKHAKKLMHGKVSNIKIETGSSLFEGINEYQNVARYHSLAVDKDTMSSELNVIAVTKDGEIMAVEHKKYPVYGVQFHPESILTENGKQIISNFLKKNRQERLI